MHIAKPPPEPPPESSTLSIRYSHFADKGVLADSSSTYTIMHRFPPDSEKMSGNYFKFFVNYFWSLKLCAVAARAAETARKFVVTRSHLADFIIRALITRL